MKIGQKLRILLCAVAVIAMSATQLVLTTSSSSAAEPPGWSGPSVAFPVLGPLSAISCPTTTFCGVAGENGTGTLTVDSSLIPPRWVVNPSPDIVGFSSISCPSASFCLAIGDLGTELTTYNGSTWGDPQAISGQVIQQVSCASATLCVAINNQQEVTSYDGTSWATPSMLGVSAVSCAAGADCYAAEGDTLYEFDGTTWSSSSSEASSIPVNADQLSCPTTSFCAASDGNSVTTYDGTSWSAPEPGPYDEGVSDLSCASATLCGATADPTYNSGTSTDMYTYDGTGWSPATVNYWPDLVRQLVLTCGGTMCVAFNPDIMYYTQFNGSSWTNPLPAIEVAGAAGLSCTFPDFCVATAGDGFVAVYNGTTWSSPEPLGSDGLSVSCPVAGSCLAVDGIGDVYTFNGSTWSLSTTIPFSLGIFGYVSTTISCPTTSFCAITTGNGQASEFNGTTWSAVQSVTSTPLTQVSCTSATFCMAANGGGSEGEYVTGDSGEVYTFNGVSWSFEQTFSDDSFDLSCASASFCMAVGDGGALEYDGTGWSTEDASLDPSGTAWYVSCPTSTFCQMADLQGNVSTFDGTSWTTPTSVAPSDLANTPVLTGTCASPSFCMILDWLGYDQTFTTTTPPAVDSVAPDTGPGGGGTTVTVTGTNFTGATAVDFGGTAATSFTVDSDTSITAVAPAESAGTVDITVTTPAGTSAPTSSSAFTFILPVVSNLTPNTGPTSGGTTVTITGTDFDGVTGVNFGAVGASSFSVVSPTEITAVSPPSVAATVGVSVVTSYGTSHVPSPAVFTGDLFTYVGPYVTRVTPALASDGGGGVVTVTGSGFAGVTAVHVGTVAATSFDVVSSKKLTAVVPSETAGTVDLTVTTAAGTSPPVSGDRLTLLTPSLTRVGPAAGAANKSTTVTLTGVVLGGATAVHFGTVAAVRFTVRSSTTIVAVAPPQPAGTVGVTVTSSAGVTSVGALDMFTYKPTTVTRITPTSGSTAGGTAVLISGTLLTGATSVTFGGVPATGVMAAGTSIIATSPAHAAGTVDVEVTDPSGTTAPVVADHFTYVVPAVTHVSPASGTHSGGTTVIITGVQFRGATAVTFGGVGATSFMVTSATSITAVSPAGSPGIVDVRVTTAAGQTASSSADHFTYV